jgi:hypothetical protein
MIKKNAMKHLIFLSSLILIHFLTCSQPKIDKITWVGQNNEHLNISKKTASLQKGMKFQEFGVVKYVKNNYIILAQIDHGTAFAQMYNIVHFTKDTLILVPEGMDFFELCEANEQNQYIFVNSLLTYKFVSLYYETPINNHYGVLKRVAIYIDSARNSKITLTDESIKKTITFKSSIDKKDYERLIKILSSCDISNYPEVNTVIDDKNCRRQIFEIRCNAQIKTFKGCNGAFIIPSGYADLSGFLAEFVSLKANIDIKSERKKGK